MNGKEDGWMQQAWGLGQSAWDDFSRGVSWFRINPIRIARVSVGLFAIAGSRLAAADNLRGGSPHRLTEAGDARWLSGPMSDEPGDSRWTYDDDIDWKHEFHLSYDNCWQRSFNVSGTTSALCFHQIGKNHDPKIEFSCGKMLDNQDDYFDYLVMPSDEIGSCEVQWQPAGNQTRVMVGQPSASQGDEPICLVFERSGAKTYIDAHRYPCQSDMNVAFQQLYRSHQKIADNFSLAASCGGWQIESHNAPGALRLTTQQDSLLVRQKNATSLPNDFTINVDLKDSKCSATVQMRYRELCSTKNFWQLLATTQLDARGTISAIDLRSFNLETIRAEAYLGDCQNLLANWSRRSELIADGRLSVHDSTLTGSISTQTDACILLGQRRDNDNCQRQALMLAQLPTPSPTVTATPTATPSASASVTASASPSSAANIVDDAKDDEKPSKAGTAIMYTLGGACVGGFTFLIALTIFSGCRQQPDDDPGNDSDLESVSIAGDDGRSRGTFVLIQQIRPSSGRDQQAARGGLSL